MPRLTRLVLDVLKPHEPGIVALAVELAEVTGVDDVEVQVDEIDQKTATVTVTVRGSDLSLPVLVEVIEASGGALHSVDGVTAVGAPSP